jgi:hypothetical protein
MNEFSIAVGTVIVMCYLGMDRISLGQMVWASTCVFIGYCAGALHVIHALVRP